MTTDTAPHATDRTTPDAIAARPTREWNRREELHTAITIQLARLLTMAPDPMAFLAAMRDDKEKSLTDPLALATLAIGMARMDVETSYASSDEHLRAATILIDAESARRAEIARREDRRREFRTRLLWIADAVTREAGARQMLLASAYVESDDDTLRCLHSDMAASSVTTWKEGQRGPIVRIHQSVAKVRPGNVHADRFLTLYHALQTPDTTEAESQIADLFAWAVDRYRARMAGCIRA